MYNTAIYPITSNNSYLVECILSECPGMHLVSAVVLGAYRNTVSLPSEISVFHKLTDAFSTVERIIFVSFHDTERLFRDMLKAVDAGKHIICTASIPQDKLNLVREASEKAGVTFVFENSEDKIEFLKKRSDVYTVQECPVIAVGSLTKGISSLESALRIAIAFRKSGIRTSVVSPDSAVTIAGGTWMPLDKMTENNLDTTVVQINRFFTLLQLNERPELIVLHLPEEGLYRPSNDFECSYGALTYLISQAVDIDVGVILSPMMELDSNAYELITKTLGYRYGIDSFVICIEELLVDTSSIQGSVSIFYYLAPKEDAIQYATTLQSETDKLLFLCDENDKYSSAVKYISSILS